MKIWKIFYWNIKNKYNSILLLSPNVSFCSFSQVSLKPFASLSRSLEAFGELQPLELIVSDNGGGMKKDPTEVLSIFTGHTFYFFVLGKSFVCSLMYIVGPAVLLN